MSSILEALERAEVERVRSSDPVVHPLPSAGSEKRLNMPLIAGGLVLLLLINLLVWWVYLREEQQPEPPPGLPLGKPPVSAPASAPAAKPDVTPKPMQELPEKEQSLPEAAQKLPEALQKSPQPKQEQPVLSLREQLQKSAAPSARPLFEEAKVPPKPVVPAAPAKPAGSSLPLTAKEDADKPAVMTDADKPLAVAKPVATARPPVTSALPVAKAEPPLVSQLPQAREESQAPPAEQIPLVWELSQGVREKVLQLKSTVHVYSEQPEQRFIIINMRRYSEGDSLPPDGFRLERIDQDGVVIDHGEGLVRLPRR